MHEPANTARKRDSGSEPVRYNVLSHRAIALWAVLIVAVGVGMAVWLLLAHSAGDDPRVQLDAIRTAVTVVVGAGGAAALLLAARRQRTAEIALKQKDRDQADAARAHALQEAIAVETRVHQERVAAATEADAAARRITELYTQAIEQLGADKAPVRLGGLYALERLAQNNPTQRQTIVNVWCAYLRMPFTPPEPDPPGSDADETVRRDYQERVQEREVRLTAQFLLRDHLRPGFGTDQPGAAFWADIDLNLTGATLIYLNLVRCTLRRAIFHSATFINGAAFESAKVAELADFNSASFTGNASFKSAGFTDIANFKSANFIGLADFKSATFTSLADFRFASFTGNANFKTASFTDTANFKSATFTSLADFKSATFSDAARFGGARFAGGVPAEVERFWSPPPEAPEDEEASGDAETGQ